MKISCCVFDLDGTLLNSKNTISETDKKTLRKLSDNGVKIIIATGRTDLQIKEYIHELGIYDYSITCNGGQIINVATRDVLHRKFIDKNDAITIHNAVKQSGIDYLFYTPDCIYHCQNSARAGFFYNYNQFADDKFKVPLSEVKHYSDDYTNILKFLIADSTLTPDTLNTQFNSKNTLTIVSSGKNLVDIMPADTTKGNGIAILSEKLNIPIPEIIAFGDSMNDETMLKAAGYSVAMGNAVPEIKKICDFVTKSHDDFGITHAIEHILSI